MPHRPPTFKPHGERKKKEDNRASSSERGYGGQWRKLRAMHLRRQPFCVFCKDEGRATAAEVVDHIKPHKGNWAMMFDPENLQSLCKFHHDSTKQRIEKSGKPKRWGVDGLPIE